MKQKKIVMYMTNKNGEGFVQKVGEYDDIRDIEVRVGMFREDVVISFYVEFVEEDEYETNKN